MFLMFMNRNVRRNVLAFVQKDYLKFYLFNRHITDVLNEDAEFWKKSKGLSSVSLLTSEYHVYPDYHGNRSPLADPDLKGMVS